MIRRLSDRFWNYLADRIEARMHLRPEREDTLDLGSSGYQWRRLYLGPGSVSAPALTLGDDTDTGIYQSAADKLDFATGGVRRLNVSSTITSYANTLFGAFMQLSPTSVTISNGAISVSRSSYYVDTEGGAASDDLDTINGGSTGAILVLRTVANARAVTVKHNTGNIRLNGATDFTLDHSLDRLVLIYDVQGFWVEIGRGNNT